MGGTDPEGIHTMTSRSEVLSTADHLVSKDRADVYGPPRQSFGRIGALWGAMLGTDAIPPATVALMLVQLKVSRIVSSPGHEDSWADLAGYAALGGELATEDGRERAALARSVRVGDLDRSHVGRPIEFLSRNGWRCTGTLAEARPESQSVAIRLSESEKMQTYVDRTTLVLFTDRGEQ
ncbi:hypothetical protein J2X60_002984 [Curtobacterium sp. 320]|uniref:DUF6378 domain-containing protein n=1 Tax=Curtobacterium sp. 320 TaxID=2817749 RepID=UPI002854B1B4|nr:DUF6378 domain-containing protein [Curtobacterium sp. 320]MDR6574325.1 hypothetical protein [Curtobacterium sp. 320]